MTDEKNVNLPETKPDTKPSGDDRERIRHSLSGWQTGLIMLLVIVVAGLAASVYLLLQRVHKLEEQAKSAAPAASMPGIDMSGMGSMPGMDMSGASGGAKGGGKQGMPGMENMPTVELQPSDVAIANVKTALPMMMGLSRDIQVVGTVAYNERGQTKQTAWIGGRIDKLFVTAVGDYIRKGQKTMELYSPDLITAENELINAAKNYKALASSKYAEISSGAKDVLKASRVRLKRWGLTDAQIQQVEETGKPIERINIYATQSGTVTDKMVQEGQYVDMGMVLFSLADLSNVWVDFQVYESDLPLVNAGMPITLSSPALGTAKLSGRVEFIYPDIDPMTRTAKVRTTFGNPGGRLKPEMYVQGAITLNLGEALTVPNSAVITTGKRTLVYVEYQKDHFMRHDVVVGGSNDQYTQILSDITATDRIAVDGGYLLDADVQLQQGGGSMPGMDMGGDKGGQAAGKQGTKAKEKGKQPAKKGKKKSGGGSMPGMDMGGR